MPVIEPAESERNFTPNVTGVGSRMRGFAGVAVLSHKDVPLGGGAPVPAHDRMALFTSSRPPLLVMVLRLVTGSTLLSKVLLSAEVFSVQADRTSIAAPETCGVAME